MSLYSKIRLFQHFLLFSAEFVEYNQPERDMLGAETVAVAPRLHVMVTDPS